MSLVISEKRYDLLTTTTKGLRLCSQSLHAVVKSRQYFCSRLPVNALRRKKISAIRQTLVQSIRQLLRQWHTGDPPDLTPLIRLRLYKNLAIQTGQVRYTPFDGARQLLSQALTILQERNEQAGSLLQQRYLHNLNVKQMARQLKVSEHHYYRLQNRALDHLTDVILEQEQEAQTKHRLAVEARLEPPIYRQLFGVKQERQHLRSALEQEREPWIISIEGIGGIGKTSLADALVRDLLPAGRFYDIAWVSAKQQYFLPSAGLQQSNRPTLDVESLTDTLLSQLAGTSFSSLSPEQKFSTLNRLFKSYPYLVVIDNLETVADYQILLPALYSLTNPTKILLTSRHSLCSYSGVFCVKLKELNQDDVFAFLKHEARARGLLHLSNASEEQLKTICEVVGGNPLALKLVIGQTCVLPLSQVLENLKQAQGKRTDDLYTYIYWQAWNTLAPASQQALLVMPLAAPQGSTFEHLAAISGLDAAELSQALDQLAILSLVDVSGTIEQRRYRIHRLTETFLMTEVINWQSSS